jgi:anthranilate synthase/aminodeoxychorismate synthase-like glutamine amidotransferase
MKVLLIDNYDSFTYNLYQCLGELGAGVEVVRNDAVALDQLEKMKPDAIMLSPGPGHPANKRDFGVCSEVLRSMSTHIPTLGVCLGHQGLAYVYGGTIKHAPRLMHGKVSLVYHDSRSLFEGLDNPFPAGRYHSLIVDGCLPEALEISARTAEGEIMGLRHRRYPIEGVQFHPESVLTPSGKKILQNFLVQARR